MNAAGASARVGGAWERLCREEPGALALVTPDGARVSRFQLQQRAEAWVAALPDPGALRRRRVALAAPNGAAWFAAFLGLMKLGAVAVLLDRSDSEAVLREAGAALGASWLCLGGPLLPLAGDPLPRGRREDQCLVKVTSGSTGKPKGLAFTHAQMLADGRQVCAAMGIRAEDRNLAVIPLGHSYGLGNLVLPLLQQGTAVVCADSPLPSALAELCAAGRPTVFPAVPMLLRVLLRSAMPEDSLRSLRLVITAGARIDPADARAFRERFGLRVHNFYGSSETGGICYDPTGEVAEEGRSVGRPMPGVRLEFVRGGRFRVSGEAVLGRGSFLMPDQGELTEDGELRLGARVGRVVKIAGRRLDLAGLEAEICALPGVRGAVVAPHPGRVDHLAALVATESPVQALREALAGRLAAWKVPERLRVIAELPHTERGKVDRVRALALLG